MVHATVQSLEADSAFPQFAEHFENIVEPFAVLTPEGRPLYANAAWQGAFSQAGYQPETVMITECLRAIGGEDGWLQPESGRIDLASLPFTGDVELLPSDRGTGLKARHPLRATLRLHPLAVQSDDIPSVLCSLLFETVAQGTLQSCHPVLESIGDSFDLRRIAGKTCHAIRDLLEAEAVALYVQSPEPHSSVGRDQEWECIERLGQVELMQQAPEILDAQTVGGFVHDIDPLDWFKDMPPACLASPDSQGVLVALRAQGDLLALAMVWGRGIRRHMQSRPDVLHAICFATTQAIEHARWFRLARFSENRSAQIVESANVLIIGMDPGGQVTLWNQKAAETLGHRQGEALGRPLANILGAPVANLLIEAGLDASSKLGEIETSLTDTEGQEHQIVWSISRLDTAEGRIFGLTAIGHDLTQRYRLAHKLAQSEERYRHLVESTHDLYWILTSPELEQSDTEGETAEDIEALIERLRIRFVNRSFAGQRPPDLIDQPIQQLESLFLDKEHWSEFRRACKRVLTQGIAVRGIESVHKNLAPGEKQPRYMQSDFFPLRSQGKLVGVQILSIDISEKREMETQMLQAQKLESIGTLSRGLSHDFNNILNGMNGFLYLIERQCQDREDAMMNVNRVRELISRASRLTRQMQTYARQGEPEKRAVDLNEIIRQSVDVLSASIASNRAVTVETDLDEQIDWILGDFSQIEQVVMNLCTNALEAMPDGGVLTLRTLSASIEARDRKGGEAARNYSILEVRDTGIGMPPSVRDRIFDPFFSTKKTGSGLGLSAVYGILKSHGAMVRVDSEPGIGTCFTIHFAASKHKTQTLGDAARVSPTRGGHETILVADDEESIRMVSADILRALGYRVITARDGEEAVSIFQERPQAIDLVILDVDMPNLNGRAAARIMQLAKPEVQVLFASGYSDDGQQNALRDEGFDKFISKPFTMFDLQSTVRLILDHKKENV